MSARQVRTDGRTIRGLAGWGLLVLLAGCHYRPPPPTVPLPAQWVYHAGPAPTTRLMILLPGRKDSPDDFRAHGFVAAMASAGWAADAVLLDAHLGYYLSRTLPERFAEDVLPEIRQRGYDEVWIAGISLGGMGAILLERDFPDLFDGLILLAPYLGEDAELLAALESGPLATWEPSPVSSHEVEVWRHLQALARDPAEAPEVWLGYGAKDRFAPWHTRLDAALSPDRVVVVKDGRHNWKTWSGLWEELLDRAAPP